MPIKTIRCTHCGQDGEIEIYGMEAGVPESSVFKYFGHNPFSGHMHFQCPACEIILLVNPMAVLGEGPLEGSCNPTKRNEHPYHRYGRHHFQGFNQSEWH